jgi:hypothetical protein|tara:strand:- start:925 stop:1101 length:177 start_codon:yes stop_codon:yes gene_type:complete
MKNLTNLFKDILELQRYRNELLIDSDYGSFALSDDAIYMEALKEYEKQYLRIFKQEVL